MIDPGPIDFERAWLEWTTKSGSHGRWRVIASALRTGSLQATPERFVLAPAVMAGDVYGTGKLVREPPYSFQIVASSARHAIVRDFLDGTTGKDSESSNEDNFSDLQIETPVLTARRIDRSSLTTAEIARAWPLTARLKAKDRNQVEWLLDFPVLHINTARIDGSDAFQVETGPVLVPVALMSNTGVSSSGGFALAYIYFNRLDRADLAVFGPAETSTFQRRDFRVIDRLDDVSIELYGKAEGP